MYRPGPGQESPQGTTRPSFRGPPRFTMPKPSQFGPPPSMHGRGSPLVPPPGHSQHFSSQYPGYPGSERGAGQPPPHPPGSATIDRMPSSPLKAAERRIVDEPPLAPQDQEMLKNIDILASFVVKNGPQFEDMARQKQANDPKFGFLFGGGPGSDAALGQAYYEWKKRCLIAAANSPADALVKPHSNNESKVDAHSPLSPDGSDMNMEDDFGEPSQAADIKSDQVQEPVSNLHAKREPTLSSRTETNSRPQGAQNPRVPTPLSVLHQSNSATASRISPQVPSQPAISNRPQSDTAHDELPKRKDTRRRTGFDRPCMEDVTPVPSSPIQTKPQELDTSAAVEVQRSRVSSRVSRWGLQDPNPLQDSSRRPSFSVDAQNNNFQQDPDRSLVKEVDTSELDDRLEAVTPQRDDSEHEIKGAKDSLLKDTSSRLEDRKSTDYPTKPDRYQTKDSLFRSENRKMQDSDARRARDSPSTLEDLSTRDGSPRISKQKRDVSEPDTGSKAPTVDEFGRFVQPGGSESDAEDSHADRKRRNGSGSRSRSPSDNRRRRRSRSRSPRRHSRRSHSRSRSPRRRRSRSKSPHGRDSRRGGDGARGWERGHQDRSDRGGRKGGRGDRGGGPPQCLDFSRGRCKRGDGCRFAHSESAVESTNEGRYERGGGRGGRGSRQDDRQESHDSGRSHGGSISKPGWGEDISRARRGWEPNDGKEKIHKKESRKSLEEMAREQPVTSPVSDYGNEFGAKPSEPPYSGDPGGLPTLAQLPPPPPPLPRSQGFSSASIPPQQSYMGYPSSQSGFNLPPPPPPTNQNRHPPMSQQPSYGGSETQQPALAPPQVSSGFANLSQLGGQSMTPSSRPGYTWQTTPTAAPASMAYTGQPVQATGAQSNYGLPPPPPTSYTNSLSQYQLPQQTQAGQSGEQFNMMADRTELGRPTAADAGVKGGQENIAVSSMDQWKGNGGNGTSRHMDDVILESVSPGLLGHHHMENVSPGPGPGLVMESVSPELVAHASNASAVPQPAMTVSTFGSSQHDNPPGVGLESVSPAPEEPQNWSPGGGDETNKGDKRADKRNKRDKEDNKIRGLTLLRTAVAEHVKETLKPTWREGQMSKEAFKTIAKKAVDKVLSVIKPHQVPNTGEKVAVYMENARPKITKLVQGYVDKYVKS